MKKNIMTILLCVWAGMLQAQLHYSAPLRPVVRQQIAVPIKAQLIEMPTTYGTTVAPGDRLWLLKAPGLETQYRQAQAECLEMAARYTQLQSPDTHPQLLSLNLQRQRTAEMLAHTTQHLMQTRALYEKGLVSAESLAQEVLTEAEQRRLLDSLVQEYNHLAARLNGVDKDIAQLQYENATAHVADLEQIRAALTVRAAVAGVLVPVRVHDKQLRTYMPGDWLEPEQVLAQIVASDTYQTTLLVDEFDVMQLSVGMPVQADVIALMPKTIAGHISAISPIAAQAQPGTASQYAVEIAFETTSALPFDLQVMVHIDAQG